MTIETEPNRQRIVAAHTHATIHGVSMASMGFLGAVAAASALAAQLRLSDVVDRLR
jgi:hypothetical protein